MVRKIIKFFREKFNKKKEVKYYCKRCGKLLTDPTSKKMGFGKCCYQKEVIKNQKHLF